MWYLTPQLITMALTDKGLEDSNRQEMAKVLHRQERNVIKTGKPSFPVLMYGATVTRQNMSVLIQPESWLAFDLRKLSGSQDWLLTPSLTGASPMRSSPGR